MNIRNLIRNGGVEDAEFARAESALRSSNRGIVRVFSLFAAAVLAVMLIASAFTPGLAGNAVYYGGALVVSAALFLAATYPGRKSSLIMLIVMYCFAMLILLLGTMLGTVSGPDEISATYIAFLLAVPQLFVDRPIRMIGLIAVSDCVFIVLALKVKADATHASDITNALVFGVVSIVLMTYSVYMKVSRYCLQERIRFMAENDQLTGLRNRNSYEARLTKAELLKTRSLYCVYVDVNGLHDLNNSQGHEAGDRMLQFVASVMRAQFGQNDTYRIGGDEFVVLGSDRGLDEINALVRRMKDAVEAAGYHVAAGVSYREKCGIEVTSLVKDAEKEMYGDKDTYYQNNNIARRKKHG